MRGFDLEGIQWDRLFWVESSSQISRSVRFCQIQASRLCVDQGSMDFWLVPFGVRIQLCKGSHKFGKSFGWFTCSQYTPRKRKMESSGMQISRWLSEASKKFFHFFWFPREIVWGLELNCYLICKVVVMVGRTALAGWTGANLHHNSYCVSLINALLKLWNYKRKKRMHLFRLLIH